MKILALDLGKKRIGMAISEDKIVASLDTIVSENFENVISKIAEISFHEEVDKIVIGLPKGNEKSEDQVHSFALKLNKLVEVPIEFVDETLTSKEAERMLKLSKLNPRTEKYKQEVDKISAKLILEQYLESLH